MYICVCVYREILFSHKYTHAHTQTHTGTLCSHKKENILPVVIAWMNLEAILPSEVSQEEKESCPFERSRSPSSLLQGPPPLVQHWTRHDCSPAAQMRIDQVGDQVSEALITALRWAPWGCLWVLWLRSSPKLLQLV